MEDLISRKAVLELLRSDKYDYATIYDRVNCLPSVTQRVGEWIPVSERLPEESDYCLCCDKDRYITIGFISKWTKEWCFDDDEVAMDVVAWMPLPKPYEPQESEE